MHTELEIWLPPRRFPRHKCKFPAWSYWQNGYVCRVSRAQFPGKTEVTEKFGVEFALDRAQHEFKFQIFALCRFCCGLEWKNLPRPHVILMVKTTRKLYSDYHAQLCERPISKLILFESRGKINQVLEKNHVHVRAFEHRCSRRLW